QLLIESLMFATISGVIGLGIAQWAITLANRITLPFDIDFTAGLELSPTVLAFTPADGATGVSPAVVARVDFSEAMNRPTAEAAFSLMRLDTSAYVPGTFAWTASQVSFTPSAALAQGVVYRTRVNATARDQSDPGNTMGAVRTASFTTADVSPPIIASVTALPSPQEVGLAVNVSAAVTDNGLVSGVWIDVRDPGGGPLGNVSAPRDPGTGRYFRYQTYSAPGLHAFTVSAVDAAGNWAVATGSFSMVDTGPPAIVHTPVTQGLLGAPIRITATVTDAQGVADVRIDYTDVLGARLNVSMALNATLYEYDIPGQPALGTVAYFLWARDPSANTARTPDYSIAIVAADVTPPVIASAAAVPPVQNASFPVNITATITDNVAIRRADVIVRDPASIVLGNFSMARDGASDAFYYEATYLTLGTYTFDVWAVDTSDNNATASGSFEIVDQLPPVFLAVAVTPPVQEVGLAVNVSATVTDNVAVAGVQALVLDAGANVVADVPMARSGDLFWLDRSYATLGTHTFTLTATDTSGRVATDGGSFTMVDTTPPVARAGPDRLVGTGTLVTFDGSGSTDNVGIANHTWTFTDVVPIVLYGAGPSYTFGNLGNFLVTLTVLDTSGNPGTDTLWVNVSADAQPPVARAGPGQTVVQGTLVTLDGSASTDDTGIAAYTWTFADPTPVTLSGAVVTRTFWNVRNITVTLTVRDVVGKTGTDTTWVDVRPDNEAPVANAGPDQTISLGQSASLDGSASTDNVGIVNYTWLVERTGALLYGPTVTHAPNAGGVWRFVLTVKDAAGLTGADDVNVTVIDPAPPAAPINLTAVTHGVGAIRLAWTANGEPDLAGYLVYRSTSADGPFIRVNLDPFPEATYVDAGLEPGRRYWYEVRAVDDSRNPSEPSNRADAVAGAEPAPPSGWTSLLWIAGLAAVVAIALIALLARRRHRPEEPVPPPPPTEGPEAEPKTGPPTEAPAEPPKEPPVP
ncbi:MAG: PKD domain-containing protein, partial [Candidatus Thermoplasmatota archaeon]